MKFGKYKLTDWSDGRDEYYNRYDELQLFAVTIKRIQQNYTSWELSLWSVIFRCEAHYLQPIFDEIYTTEIIDSRVGIQNTVDNFLLRMDKIKVFI